VGSNREIVLDSEFEISSGGAVLFAPGCNLRCPFCHNWRIAVDPKPPFLTEEIALRILDERKKYVDAVVVSRGEPTIHKELPRFLKKLKDRGFTLRLDTNGFESRMLEECLPYLDYVALDVKTSLQKYMSLGAKDTTELARTIEILKMGKIDYEFRTTVVPGLVDTQDIHAISELVKGARTWALQQFVPGDTLDKRMDTVKPFPPETLDKYADTLRSYAERIVVRT
jgi:pyruvate formate lyase activating enzyme